MTNYMDSIVRRRLSGVMHMVVRLRRYQQGLMVAASVSIGQIGSDQGGVQRQPYTIVRLINETPESFSRMERVGNQILTRELLLEERQMHPRRIDQLN